jgi:hypothetical protein
MIPELKGNLRSSDAAPRTRKSSSTSPAAISRWKSIALQGTAAAARHPSADSICESVVQAVGGALQNTVDLDKQNTYKPFRK